MHTYVPRACPDISLPQALQCLSRDAVTHVVYVTDSIGSEELASLSCYRQEHTSPDGRGSGSDQLARLAPQLDASHRNITSGDRYMWVERRLDTGHALVELMGRRDGAVFATASSKAEAVAEAAAVGLLPANAIYVVNAGLWHMVCTPEQIQAKKCIIDLNDYRMQLMSLLDALTQHAPHSRIIWRDTTEVHPGRMSENVSATARQKFARFDSKHVEALNRAAQAVLANYSHVEVLDCSYPVTRHRADNVIEGDIRHYRADVLRTLTHISFLAWCRLLTGCSKRS